MNLEQARFNMVEQQIRPWEVLDQHVLDLMEEAPRDEFVPPEYRRLAYADLAIALDDSEAMMPPRVEARMLQALRLHADDRVLEIGTGTGFVTYLLSRLCTHVTSVEISTSLAAMGRANLEQHAVTNATLEVGNAASGWERDAPYDVIAVTASARSVDDGLARQMTIGGRMFVVVGEGPVMEATLVERIGESEWTHDSLFDTVLPPLRGTAQPDRFVF